MSYIKVLMNESALSGVSTQRKEWIATAIGAGLSLASSLWGGHKASQATRKANSMIAAEKSANDVWFRRRYNEHYLDTSAGQNLMRQAREYADKNWKRAQGASKVGGATDEASALAKEAGNKVISDTVSNIAAQDTARKASVDAQHRSMQHQLTQQQVGIEQNRAAQITNAAQNASNALLQAGTYIDGANTAKTAAAVSSPSGVMTNTTGQNYYTPSNIIGNHSVDELENIVGVKR